MKRLFTIGFLLLMALTAFSQKPSPTKAVAAKNGDAVVTVKISVKMRVSGGGETSNEEQKNEIIGTVISPDGIILVPLSATDPTDIISRAYGDSDESNFKMNVDVVELKVRTPEGLEIPGKVVLRDQDMDLAFIKLNKKPAHPMKYVDISRNAPTQLLDDVIVMGRTGPSLYRSLCVNCEKVEVMVKKPQPFYILTHSGNATNLGSPIFDYSGRFVGIMVLRATTQLRGSNNNNGPHIIVRPAEVIVKSAESLLKNANSKPTVKNTKTVAKPSLKGKTAPVKKKSLESVKKIKKTTPVKKTAAASIKKKTTTVKPAKATGKSVVRPKKMDVILVKKVK